jgi:O-antigen ligase
VHRLATRNASTPGTSIQKYLLFLLVGVFLILAPASVSGGTEAATLKWVRVGVLVAATLVGARWFRLPSLSDLSGKLLLLAVVFTAAAIWSTSPYWGLLFKGMFVCAVCASISLANCLRGEADFRALTRALTFTAFVGVVIVGYLVFVSEDYVIWKGRLVLAQMNANSLGISAAIFALLCLFHLLIRDRMAWRILAITVIAITSVLVVYSGSRAAALTVIAGVMLLFPAMAKTRRGVLTFSIFSVLSLTTVAVVWFSLPDAETRNSYRLAPGHETESGLRILQEFTKDTRMKVWSGVTNRWLKNDLVLGAGWLHRNNKWSMVQSSYLQVVAEAGLPGLLCIVIFLFGGASTLYRALRLARYRRGFASVVIYLFAATFFAMAFHAIFESAAVVGSSPNAILLGFSAAQLDTQLRLASSVIRRREPVIHRRVPNLAQG